VNTLSTDLPGALLAPGSDNEGMLRAANVIIRAAAVLYVGIRTFIAPWPGTADGLAQIAAFAVTVIVLTLWSLAAQSPAARQRIGRWLPWALAVIAVACGPVAALPGDSNFLILSVVAVVAAASRTSPASAWTVAALGAATFAATGLARGTSGWDALGYPVILLAALLLGLNRRFYRVQAEQAAALAARSEQLREEQATTAALDERARIAREIHDVLAHSLGALGLEIQLAQAVLTDQHDEARAVELLDQARRMAADGLAETRRAVHALRGQTPPLPEGLAELSADHQRRHGAPVTFEVTGDPRALPPDAGLALTRTAQEALVNAAKHAPHEPVQVRLDYTDAGTSLLVTSHLREDGDDEGRERALATVNGGYGLTGMRERLLLLDGTLSAGPRGDDWVVEARVPR
jgi:signal transduction histidine kinase